MAETTKQGPFTYTRDRVRQILLENLCPESPPNAPGYPRMFDPVSTLYYINSDGLQQTFTESSRHVHIKKWHDEYLAQLNTSEGHLERLDSAFSGLLRCNFRVAEDEVGDIVNRACTLLSRLPVVSPNPGMVLEGAALDADHFLPGLSHTWETLRAVQFVDANTIRLALKISIDVGVTWYGPNTVELLDTVGEITQVSLQTPPRKDPVRQLPLTAFLWSSFHRLMMLHFSYILGLHLSGGYNYYLNEGVALGGKDLLQQVYRAGVGTPEMAGSMCRCAFELLRSERASVALDFRDFHKRFAEALGDQPPRCIISEHDARPCAGDNPYSCMRFRGAKIEDQSAHAVSCTRKCPKLFWSEESFRKGSGARAVSLDETTDDMLIYCPASERTMAISHVWSHGQGGRPEHFGTGFNKCLHDRYTKIAKTFDCDSYWMDTPCIPQDHQLRFEAIQNINKVFRESRLTLVCDRDLMLIDATNATLEVYERILAVVLVCDWNVRAWTLLEAMRGRHDIWLLCKGDHPVSFREALQNVHQHGSIALSNLFMTSQHLLPAFKPIKTTQQESMKSLVQGFVTVEEAAMLLSHRHATRPGDEVVIWSLLIGDTVPKSVSEFWNMSPFVRTGFLMSSVPRLDENGRSWAPIRPDMPEEEYKKGTDRLCFHQDGIRTDFADVVGDGLDAPWFIGELPVRHVSFWTNLVDFLASFLPDADF